MSKRRLIETIRGRAATGDQHLTVPLAARPRVVRTLSRTTFAVGAAGVAVVLASTLGGSMLTAAAGAAVGGGASYTTAQPARPEAELVVATSSGPPAELGTIPTVPATPTTLAPVAVPTPAPVRVDVPPAPVLPPVAPGSVEAIIAEVFGPYAQQAIGVARCESHLHPDSISRNGANWGLFQINIAHRARVEAMGYRWEQLLDPRVNSLVARSIFDEQGWHPWGCRAAAR